MNKDFNLRLVLKILGSLLWLESIFIFLTALVSWIYSEPDWIYFVGTGIAAVGLGTAGISIGRNAPKILSRREGTLIVVFTWVVFSLVGLMPFWLSGSIPSFTDAFFETMSGFTTTGGTVLDNIEDLSYTMLFWRSLTHWIGGLGIVVISLALLPMFSFSGIQLFGAEIGGPTKDKIHPKITETAKRLGAIYVILTLAAALLLRFCGDMGWYDAVCHALGTVSSGGCSTKAVGIAYWTSPVVHYIIIVFMMLSGISFSLYYFALKGRWSKVKNNDELRYFFAVFAIAVFVVLLFVVDFGQISNFSVLERSVREVLFQVAAMLTTTGFFLTDFTQWNQATWIILLILMISGASAGSTTGGIKMVRLVIVCKYCYYEFKHMIHPNAVIPITYSRQAIKSDVVTRVLAFVLLYLMVVAFGAMVLSLSGIGFSESIWTMVSCLGGVGSSIGTVGPDGNFSALSDFLKWFLAFVMLLGRLELFTVLLIFTPVFWKK
ncbi:MAG: TrkH family potassium uptake protein [Prevotellaceae bacterium]|jgi:trk system potassium uptake protein TrkH|nr:TrkH family potassium uptake protein [Prevotellaceae bacterium]